MITSRSNTEVEAKMLFIDEMSSVDKEALRSYVLEQLKKFDGELERIMYGPENREFWDRLHNKIGSCEDEKERSGYKRVERQLINLKSYLEGWRSTSVASQERFEMFVQTKASELNSGDEKRDYFWAMQVRHDQLVALVTVVERLLEKMRVWVGMRPDEVLKDSIFTGLVEYGLENQVYLEAENIHKQRKAMTAK